MMWTQKMVKELALGDETPWYIVVRGARKIDGEWVVDVVWPDGGRTQRSWDNGKVDIPVRAEVATDHPGLPDLAQRYLDSRHE